MKTSTEMESMKEDKELEKDTAAETEGRNPLLEEWRTPHGIVPFEEVKVGHFVPAIRELTRRAWEVVEGIATNPEAPTFENTVAALDEAEGRLADVAGTFYNLNACLSTPEMQQAAREVARMLDEHASRVRMDERLWHRVDTVWREGTSGLSTEERRLAWLTWKEFVDGGAKLEGRERERFREVTTELSQLSLAFDEHVLGETNGFSMEVTDEEDLAGLPATSIAAAREEARHRGLDGWVFTLQAPSYVPFMRYAEKRDLREVMYRAYARRGCEGNERDNGEVARRMAALRLEKAQLLGYATYAEWALTNRMAGTPARVEALLEDLHAAARPAAERERDEVEFFARRHGLQGRLERWDWAYYSNLLRKEKYHVEEEEARPYLKLEQAVEGVFGLAGRLYGLRFREREDLPKYHEDVRGYEVEDERGEFLGVIYLDFFPRRTKTGGAWMTQYRVQRWRGGKEVRPVVSLVMNFTRGTAGEPSLLRPDEVRTLLHEFGHALHGLLGRCRYAGTSMEEVCRDFVELPSQLMENYLFEKEWLDTWAMHYQTGERIPEELVERLRQAERFQAGYACERQLGFGMLDMAWHSIRRPMTGSVLEFERKAVARTEVLPEVGDAMFTTAFTHVFAGGYAAGYYGYKWAEVLDADAFALFREKGIFDPETAGRFRREVLERGNADDPMELYKRFRGREPKVDALLERDGLLPGKK